jgi:hypothetical protein
MNARRHNLANTLALGTVATLLLCTGLFWARTLCGLLRYDGLRQAAPEARATLDLSRLRPGGGQSDPNLVRPYLVTARLQPVAPLVGLGATRYLLSHMPTGPESNVYRWSPDPDADRMYFDATLGQMVYQGTRKVTRPDSRVTRSPFAYYAGPEGVALAPDEKLGRFVDPIVDRYRMRPWIVYDLPAGRFFAVDWSGRTVKKGPELPPDDTKQPVQIGMLEKNPLALYMMGASGAVQTNVDDTAHAAAPNIVMGLMSMTDYVPVLDASGRIRFLNVDTLELDVSRMRLPAPGGLYAQRRPATPRDIAAYSVQAAYVYFPGGEDRRWSCLGCVAATLSRDATSVQLDVFDPNGGLVASDETSIPQYAENPRGEITRRTSISSTQAAYFRLPGAYGLTLTKFALESLHPPVFLLLSYFPASAFEATAGQRSLLLLPDSFVAMKARDKQGRPVEEFFASMAFAIPALVLALLLAWRVDRDGGRLGLSKNARTAWLVGTVLFGLPAYLTYRLTRPKPALVTCANCGLGRRPDLEKCHHCGSPWTLPELTPPAWRVRGEQEDADEGAPAQGSPASSPAE